MTTKKLSEFSVNTACEDLKPPTRELAKQSLLDWLGCCIRGAKEPQGEIVRRVLALQGNVAMPVATVFAPQAFRTSALDAALANGCASHALDFDDLHNTSILHTAVAVIPAALAEAERIGASGKDLIAAIVIGYEIADRIGECVNPEAYFYHHTTGTAGTFGAAAAVAKLLRLDVSQTVHTLGIAGTQAAANFEWIADGAHTKTLHAGKSNYNGMLSAYLAKEGFTGATKILEGKQGFCRAMTPNPKFEKLTEGLGEVFKIDENAFKYYPFCKHSHSSVRAASLLKEENRLDVTQIQSVVAKVNSQADVYINHPSPQTGYDAKFSLQYCLAAMLRHGQVVVESFLPTAMKDEEVQRLMRVTTVCVDPAIDAEYARSPEKWAAQVEIKMFDGSVFSQYVPYPLGDPLNPVSYAQTEQKFKNLAATVYEAEEIDRLLQVVGNLEKLENIAEEFAFLTNAILNKR